MRFAKWVYSIAGILGLLMTLPTLFMERSLGEQYPPVITHPVFYYGLIGLVVAWQLAFFLIANDPVRYRPLMLVTLVEKFPYVVTILVLYTQGRVAALFLNFAAFDFVLGVLFLIAYVRLGQRQRTALASQAA